MFGRLSEIKAGGLIVLSILSVTTNALAHNLTATLSRLALPEGVTSEHTKLNGFNIHYLLGKPSDGQIKDTIFLVHGFPDLSYGWRNQFKTLMDLGLRVVAMDSMGYGETDAPEPLQDYSFKQAADNIKALANQMGLSKVILGGHDWGGATVYDVYDYYPALVSHIFSIAVPYLPPSTINVPPALLGIASPTLGYQKQFSSGELEERIKTKDDMKKFFNTMFLGVTPEGQMAFDLFTGINWDRFKRVGQSQYLTPEDVEFYADQYMKHGLRGPCNWYRTSGVNAQNAKSLGNLTINVPIMYIDVAKSPLISPLVLAAAKPYQPYYTSRKVDTNHWAMVEDPNAVNKNIKEWIEQVVFGDKKSI